MKTILWKRKNVWRVLAQGVTVVEAEFIVAKGCRLFPRAEFLVEPYRQTA